MPLGKNYLWHLVAFALSNIFQSLSFTLRMGNLLCFHLRETASNNHSKTTQLICIVWRQGAEENTNMIYAFCTLACHRCHLIWKISIELNWSRCIHRIIIELKENWISHDKHHTNASPQQNYATNSNQDYHVFPHFSYLFCVFIFYLLIHNDTLSRI